PTARYVRQGFPVSVIPPAASCHLSGSAAACWHLLLTCGARVSVGLSCPPARSAHSWRGGGTGAWHPSFSQALPRVREHALGRTNQVRPARLLGSQADDDGGP